MSGHIVYIIFLRQPNLELIGRHIDVYFQVCIFSGLGCCYTVLTQVVSH